MYNCKFLFSLTIFSDVKSHMLSVIYVPMSINLTFLFLFSFFRLSFRFIRCFLLLSFQYAESCYLFRIGNRLSWVPKIISMWRLLHQIFWKRQIRSTVLDKQTSNYIFLVDIFHFICKNIIGSTMTWMLLLITCMQEHCRNLLCSIRHLWYYKSFWQASARCMLTSISQYSIPSENLVLDIYLNKLFLSFNF